MKRERVSLKPSSRSLRLLRMRVRSKGLGVMKLLSTHFPFLIHLDIRILFSRSEMSITDIERLHMQNLDTLRIDTDHWELYEAAIGSWTLPNLRVLDLSGSGQLILDVNPSARMIKIFFDKFGAKITHAALLIRVVYDKDWLVDWKSIPEIREIVGPNAVYFNGPAPKESKMERVIGWYRDQLRLKDMFDPAFRGRPFTIAIASAT